MNRENSFDIEIRKQLFSAVDREYRNFSSRIIPSVDISKIIGVRVPFLRSMAKKIALSASADDYLNSCSHEYHEENMLCALLISRIGNYEKALKAVNDFLPYVDNWAVCDCLNPSVFSKNKALLRPCVEKWISSQDVYTVRFGMGMAMRYFLDSDFDIQLMEIISEIRSDEYYINMMISWYFATALSKNWEVAIGYIVHHKLDAWCEKKTIQKAIESFRITPEQKAYLKTLR